MATHKHFLIPQIWSALVVSVLYFLCSTEQIVAQPTDNDITVIQRNALMKLFESTDGARWQESTNWGTDSSVCTWYGILCDDQTDPPLVTHIALNQNNLIGDIAPEVWSLPYLQHLQVRGNSITSLGLAGLSAADTASKAPIESISAAENHLTEFNNIGAASATLLNLNVNKNQIDSPLPDELFQLSKLETLYMAFNPIPGSIPTLIGQLTQLQELYAFGNAFTGMIPSEIGNLVKCQILGLGNNHFHGTLPEEVNKMINLRDLSLHHVPEDSTSQGLSGPLLTFGDMPYISLLFLDGNQFSGTIPNDFLRHNNNTKSQVSVGLAQNNLNGTIPRGLERFESLSLDLVGNQISGIPPELCDLGGWMGGLVEQYRCDAILCPIGTYNIEGRATSDDSVCDPCDDEDIDYLGATQCTDDPNDKEAWRILAGFYISVGGEKWQIKEGWDVLDTLLDTTPDLQNIQIDVCDGWTGVVCTDGKVTEISLPKNDLFGTIPKTIFTLPELRIVDFSGNNVVLEDFDGVEAATSLTAMVLSGIKITSLKGIGKVSTLRLLYMDGIDLITPIPLEFFDLSELRVFHVQHGQFTDRLPTEIGQLANLELLNLYGNDLTGPLPTELGLLVNVHALDLSENHFTGIIPYELSGMTSVSTFSIHQLGDDANSLSGPLPAFDEWPKLREVNLESNALTGKIPDNFLAGVQNKNEDISISLAHNQLSGDIPLSLSNFTRLILSLEDNKITGLPPVLCENDFWMMGEVGRVPLSDRCNAILCPPGTWNEFGKQTSHQNGTCSPCDENGDLFGQISCGETVSGNREREILDLLFQSTGGRYWNKTHDTWLAPGAPLCQREGVLCFGDDQTSDDGISELRLQGFGLQGSIPSELWELPKVRQIILTANDITLDFSGIEKATNLISLKLSNCHLRSLVGLEKLPSKVTELHLAGNQFEGSIPTQVYQLANVNKIFLNNNNFIGRLPPEIANMQKLTELWLGGNRLTGPLPSELGSIENLHVLSVHENSFSGAIPEEVANLGYLTRLQLGKQQSRGKFAGPLPAFAESFQLIEVDVNGNAFSGRLPSNFLEQADLVSSVINVNLADNRFSGAIPSEWSIFDSLNLDVTGNLIDVLPQELCDKTEWNNGLVGLLDTCDAILCPPGTALIQGKQIGVNEKCMSCDGGTAAAPYYGSKKCLNPELQAEREILSEFYDATNGTNWLIQSNWLSDNPTCTWFGIKCDDDGYVEEIELENNWVRGVDDAVNVIFTLTRLKVLDLKGNGVRLDFSLIPESSSLTFLRMSGTGMKSLGGISLARNLKALHVTNNYLTAIPEELFDLSNLESLFMSFNNIRGSISTNIGRMSSLREMYIFGNHITGSIPTEIGRLSELTDLVLASNALSGFLPVQLSSLPNLEQLSVYDQEGLELITGPVPSFSGAPNMWYFDASNNDLTGPIPDNFMLNSNVFNSSVIIFLQNNEITGTIPFHLGQFDSLDIQLGGNQIVEIPPSFCSKKAWINGDVGVVGNCSAILCPQGTFNQFGRHSPGAHCAPCDHLDDVPFLGQTHCDNFESERETLGKIFQDTGGDLWNDTTLWQSNSPICSWAGIYCEDGDRGDTEGITKIELIDNYLSGTLPSEVWTLPQLRYLNVKGNPDLVVNFEGIANAADNLEVLYLSDVKMSSLDGIAGATNLRELHLTGNDLTGTFPEELFSLAASLEHLYISYNLFFGPLPTRLGELKQLKSFFAFSNDFLSTIPSELGTLKNLRTLVLSENLLYGQIPDELSSMPQLRILSLYRDQKSGPRLSGTLPWFNRVPQMTDFYIQGNEIQGTIPEFFLAASLDPELVILSNNFLTGTVPSSLTSISAVDFQLEGNMITGIPDAFCEKNDWNRGAIEAYGCDGFLCPPGFASPVGRSVNATTLCTECTDTSAAPYYGSTTCEPPPKTREILVDLYHSLGGENWIRKDFWLSSADVCEWYGIACVSGQVVEINLRGNNLAGLPGPDLFLLPELQILWLYSNPITFSFENIGKAKKLEDLRLDATNLHSLHGIGAATSLIRLDAQFTAIKGKFPEELFSLTSLRDLSLGNNDLTGPLPNTFEDLKFLVQLDLSNNLFTGRLPAFDDTHFLRDLDLSGNTLTGAISKNIFGELNTGESVRLNLADNQITGVIPEELDRFQDMTIYLRNNRILGLPLTLCDNAEWNGGDVGNYGCDAILCKPGTSNEFGRYRDLIGKCVPCPQSTYYGGTRCHDTSSAPLIYSRTSRWLSVAIATIIVTALTLL